MGRVAAALVVLATALGACVAAAEDRATKLAIDLVSNFRELCLTDRPFEAVAVELEKQGRVRKPRTWETGIIVDSVLTEEVFSGAEIGTRPAPAYDVTSDLGDASKGQQRSCEAAIPYADYASDIAPFVDRLSELQPASPRLIKQLHDTCHGRECSAKWEERFWQLTGSANTLIVLAYYGMYPHTILTRIDLPE